MDIENPEPLVFGEKLVAAVEQGSAATAFRWTCPTIRSP
jgi:hypothetical protein